MQRYSNPHLDEAALEALSQRVCRGDRKARDELATAHLYLVVRIARQYQYYNEVELGDLIGAGNVGLVRAAELFDSAKCPVFAGYAVWWVRRMIRKFIGEQAHIMRMPDKTMRLMWHISALTSNFSDNFGRSPSTEEISAAVDVPFQEVHKLLNGTKKPLSLDEPCSYDGSYRWQDILAPPDADAVDTQLLLDSDQHILKYLIGDLKDKERRVLRSFYGLDGKKPRNLAEIGRTLGMTRERARQLRDSALERLRHPSRRHAVDSLREGH